MTNLLIKKYGLATLALFFCPFLVDASCGDITYYDRGEKAYATVPIEDCANLFNVDEAVGYTPRLIINDFEVSDGETVTVEENEQILIEYNISPERYGSFFGNDLYAKTESGYKQIIFGFGGDYFLDGLPEGDYVAVYISETLTVSDNSLRTWQNKLKDFFLPNIAYAFYEDYQEVTTISFTIEYKTPEPTGASSVLFLPGIMGSKLYEKGQQCGDFGEEQERWFSFSECEQLRLLTRFDGTSVNDIYTMALDEAVIDKIFISSLYDSFLEEMNELEENGEIADFVPFAYDWRLQLDDLLKTKLDPSTQEIRFDIGTELEDSYMYQTISDMVASSNNGKVSIVAHSNGGLLAKVFMGALEEADDPLLDKIENVILVASPQVGTPEALVGLLHGSEIGNGFVVDQVTSRRLLNTAPFGHHLLPNLDYFDSEGVEVFAPVITFNNGTATDGWVNDFGKEITDVDEMYEFLSKDSGREKPATTDLLHPEAVDNYLIDYADTMSDVLVSWDPGPRTRVYQIAGTGIETPSGITYFTDKECVRGGLLWFDCTEYLPKLGYYPNFTFDGDGTVVVPSALAMGETDGIERVWLDLSSPDLNKQHKDIFEVTQLIDFISEIILSTSTPDTPRFISRNEVVPDIGERLSFYLHSPLDMYLESSAGITSSSSSDIPGATYRRYGEVQYVSVPKDTASLTLKLKGYQTGSFTLVVQEWNGDTLVSTRDYESLPTENSTIVQLPLEAFSVNTKLKIDIDGDGVFDGEVSTEESAVNLIEVEKTEETISSPSNTSTRVATAPVGQVAGITVSAEEQWYYGEIEKILKEVAKLITLIEQQHEK